jgi:hypothetical protein
LRNRKGQVLEVKVDGEVWEGFAYCSTVRYAVIQASSKKDHPERLVIAYQDENCLRDLVAAPSIVGFSSREEAMAKLLGSMPDPRAFQPRASPPFLCRTTLNRTVMPRGQGIALAIEVLH